MDAILQNVTDTSKKLDMGLEPTISSLPGKPAARILVDKTFNYHSHAPGTPLFGIPPDPPPPSPPVCLGHLYQV